MLNIAFTIVFSLFTSIFTTCVSIITISSYWIKCFSSPQISLQMTSSGVLLTSLGIPMVFLEILLQFSKQSTWEYNCSSCKILHEKKKVDKFDLKEQLQQILDQKYVEMENELRCLKHWCYYGLCNNFYWNK